MNSTGISKGSLSQKRDSSIFIIKLSYYFKFYFIYIFFPFYPVGSLNMYCVFPFSVFLVSDHVKEWFSDS